MEGFRLAREHEALIDKMPKEHEHNLRASSLRNGLAIIGFSVLEHFIRARTGEILNSFDHAGKAFGALPDGLKRVATTGAIRGIAARLRVVDDPIAFTQDEAAIVASSATPSYRISAFGIGWENSNLGEGDVAGIMNKFNINAGWDGIDAIAKRIDLTVPSCKAAFDSAAKRRHSAAHNIATIVESSHLEAFVREAYAIAVGLDVLLSSAFMKIVGGDKDYLAGLKKVSDGDVSFRIIDKAGKKWRERREGAKKAARRADTSDALWPSALSRAKKNREVIACIDMKGFPSKWAFPALP